MSKNEHPSPWPQDKLRYLNTLRSNAVQAWVNWSSEISATYTRNLPKIFKVASALFSS